MCSQPCYYFLPEGKETEQEASAWGAKSTRRDGRRFTRLSSDGGQQSIQQHWRGSNWRKGSCDISLGIFMPTNMQKRFFSRPRGWKQLCGLMEPCTCRHFRRWKAPTPTRSDGMFFKQSHPHNHNGDVWRHGLLSVLNWNHPARWQSVLVCPLYFSKIMTKKCLQCNVATVRINLVQMSHTLDGHRCVCTSSCYVFRFQNRKLGCLGPTADSAYVKKKYTPKIDLRRLSTKFSCPITTWSCIPTHVQTSSSPWLLICAAVSHLLRNNECL